MGANKRQREQDEMMQSYVKKSTTVFLVIMALLVGGFAGVMITSMTMQPPKVRVTQQAPAPQNARPELDMARLAALQAATQSNPTDSSAWTSLGHFYYDADMAPEAIKAYERSLELAPRQADVWSDLGVMYRRVGDFQKAVHAFTQAGAMDSKHITSRFNKGIVLLHDLNDRAGALVAWKEVLAIDPNATSPSGEPVADLVKGLEAAN